MEFLQRGADWEIEHPNGFFQPGVLALTSQSRVLYRWRSIPSEENLHGTSMRPTAAHAWQNIEQTFSLGDEAEDAAHDDNPAVDSGPPPRPLFFAALIANGWFLKAKSFMYSPGSPPIPARFKRVMSRWPVFVLVWIAAFTLLPPTWVGAGLVGWIIWIARDLRKVLADMGSQVEIKPGG
jgi:hypothetical protein